MRLLRPIREWTLGAKLATTFFVLVAGVAALVSVSVVTHARGALDGELRKRGVQAVENLAHLSVDLVLQDDLWGLYKVVRDIASRSGERENVVAYAAVLDPAGRVLAHSDPARYPMGEPFVLRPGRRAGETIHDVEVPIVLDNQRIGVARVGITTRYLEATIAKMARGVVLVTCVLGALGMVLGFVISRRMTRPLRRLSQAVDRIAEGRLDEPVAITTPEKDEIGRLADRFTLMAKTLRENEARLIRSERMASVGELAGALAHEIRNPLGSLFAAAKMLGTDSPQAAGYDQAALLRVITGEARRLDHILSDFLRFARPRPPIRRPHRLNELVAEVIDSLRLDRAAEGKTFRMALEPTLPAVPVDGDQIKQVLWNIVRNALEASAPSGELRVGTRVANGTVVVEVADDGAGIPPEGQARLFEPFQTTKPGGSGLGLAIAHRIVTAHGGSIDVSSGVGAGTAVLVQLPREI